jgi:MtaA/CmuA family methyltransferase
MAEYMTSIERVRATIMHRRPDRVPVDLHNFQPAAAAMGVSLPDLFNSGELLAEAMLQAWRTFGHDMILLENGTACSAQACGAQVVYDADGASAAVEPILKELADVATLEVPDPYTTFPMCEVLKATRILSREIGDRAWICARADQGPFALAALLRGVSEWMIDIGLEEQPALIHQTLDFARRVALRYAHALIACGGHSTSIGDSVAGPDMLSPARYRQYAWAYEQQLAADLKAAGITLAIHICGKTNAILDDFVATGAPILEIDHKTDLRRAKDHARGRATLLGPINTTLLYAGTPAEVEDACREAIDILAPDYGLILGPGCAMGAATPADNIHALVEAAKRYGAY